MAKWGEGDPRWLVEERPDATNPNNWHWVEKNATPWSMTRLNEIFVGQILENNSIKVDFLELSKVEGEASANNRKAKLIFLFEWDLNVKFSARVAGSEIEYKGQFEIPNLSDENSHNEVDVNVSIETRGPHEAEIRQLFYDTGLEFIRNLCGIYIKDLKEEFSKGLILPTDKAKPQAVTTKAKSSVVNKKEFQNNVVASEAKSLASNAQSVTSVKDLNLTETFKAPPARVYELLTQPEYVKVWAGSDSIMEPKENGKFSLLGGQISGTFVNLIEGKEIKAKWRLKKYPENHFADVTFTFRDQSDSTDLVVEAKNVPDEHFNDTSLGFTRYYFQNLGRTFGIGISLF